MVGAAAAGATEATSRNLLVVGPGVLGTLVAQRWKEHADVAAESAAGTPASVYGVTFTAGRHEQLREVGILPITRDSPQYREGGNKKQAPEDSAHDSSVFPSSFPYVIFSAPPGQSEDYAAEVRLAVSKWDGTGSLLFTSSSALYDVADNLEADESAPSVPIGRSPRLDSLLAAEEAVVQSGGIVLRLAGLYTLTRGAHMYWLQRGSVDGRPDSAVNLISYEDAAALCIAALVSKKRSAMFLGVDDRPMTREEIVQAALAFPQFQDTVFQGFKTTDGPRGKRLSNKKTRSELSWAPKHASFADFLQSQRAAVQA